MTDVIDELVDAVNSHDLETLAALIHQNYESEQPAHPGRAFVGRAQMCANWAAMFAGIPDLCAEVRRTVRDGDTTWTEWQWTGTRGDGRPFEMTGVALFQTLDGQIVGGRLYMEDVDTALEGIDQAVTDLSGRRPHHR